MAVAGALAAAALLVRFGPGVWGPLRTLPRPSVEVGDDGVRVARIDVERLTDWCRDRGLPDPPGIGVAELAVGEALVDAIGRAAVERTPDAFGAAGRICESLDSHRSAAGYFRLAAAGDPANYRWPYYLGCVYQVTGESERAIEAFEHVLTLAPSYAVTYARLGQLYIEAERYDDATAMLERYDRSQPDDWLGQVGLGRIALERGEPERARRYLEEARRRSARQGVEDFQVEYYLARVYAALGDRQRAQEHFDHAARLPKGQWFRLRDPLDQELHRASGSVASLESEIERLAATGDWQRLAELAKTIIARRSGDVTMMGNLAGFYRKMQRYGDAHAVLDRALRLRPGSAHLRNVRAEVLLSEGKLAGALAAADSALALDPQLGRAHSSRGRALFLLERYDESERAMRRALEIVPDRPSDLYVLGEALLQLRRLEEAVPVYTRIIELEPEHQQARERLEWLRQLR